MCSKCFRESQAGPKAGAASPPSWTPAPQTCGILHITTLNQMGPEATALGRAEGLPTMLCGFFTCAMARLLAERFPGEGPVVMTPRQLVQLAREVRNWHGPTGWQRVPSMPPPPPSTPPERNLLLLISHGRHSAPSPCFSRGPH